MADPISGHMPLRDLGGLEHIVGPIFSDVRATRLSGKNLCVTVSV